MNAPFRTPVSIAPANPLAGMLALHRKMNEMREEHAYMPDEAWDSVSEAMEHIEGEFIGTVVETSRDVATKLRLLADLMDSDDGEHRSELTLLLAILQNIADLRTPLWRIAYRCEHPLTHLLARTPT